MSRHRASPFVFLGGPLTAVLLGACLPPLGSRVLPWFALVPFLWSLRRQRDRPFARLAHGIGLSLGVMLISLPGVVGALTGTGLGPVAGPGGGVAGGAEGWWPEPRIGLVSVLGLSAFSLAAGPILRSRRALVSATALAVLWAGIEVLLAVVAQEAMLPGGATGLLGQTVVPGAPEAMVATVIGVHGLSLLIAASAACFLFVLCEDRALRQVCFAACGTLIPLAAALLGARMDPGQPVRPSLTVVVATQANGRSEDLERLSLEPASLGAGLIVWPQVPVGRATEEGPVPEGISAGVRRLVADSGAFLVAGFTRVDPRRTAGRTGLVVIDPTARPVWWVDPDGKSRGDRADPDDPRLLVLPGGRAAVTRGQGALPTRTARDLVCAGARILVVSSTERGARNLVEALRLRRADRFVALQMHRWLVRCGALGAHVVSPSGEVRFEVNGGLGGAGMAEVALIEETTPYVRGGWWIEVAAGVATIAILAAALAGTAVARRSAQRQ